MKYGWLILAVAILVAVFVFRSERVETKEVRTVDTVYVEKPIEVKIKGKIDTVYRKVKVKETDTVYVEQKVEIAKADTTLPDSSQISVAYNITDNLFDIKAKIKERILKETVVKTEYRAAKIYLTGGVGYIHNGSNGDFGVFIGVGYAIPIW